MPWYLRTWVLTGNPLFPVDVKLFGRTIFDGLFTTERDQQTPLGRRACGTMLSATYHSLPTVAAGGRWSCGVSSPPSPAPGGRRCATRSAARA